jgi:16S rRNA (guanine527-N7)-methyltransferase
MKDALLFKKQKDLLEQNIASLGLSAQQLNNIPVDKINSYLTELQKWNKVYNLSGIKSAEDHIVRNILDCLAVQPYILGERMMDLGTGAGLPGALLAMVNQKQHWVLLDGNGKKISFLNQVKQQLELKNVEVIHSRAESFQTEYTFDGICSRAFDNIPDSLQLCQHLFQSQARFYALKGKVRKEDTEGLPDWARVENIQPIKVPGLNEERHVITIRVKK